MEVSRGVFIKAFLITVIIFLSVYSLNLYLNSQRENVLDDNMAEIIDNFEEVQALTDLMKVYGGNVTCLALESRLKLLDTQIWKLGDKIENYRQLSKDYMNDPYYQTQKEKFNRQEVMYYSILKEMQSSCNTNQTYILYFYAKGETCSKCDDQSYVLNYFNQRIDPELAVFSFDTDLNLPSINMLKSIYNVTEYPCVVIYDTTYCGLRDKDEVQGILCSKRNLSIC